MGKIVWTAAAIILAAGILLPSSCSISVRRNVKILERDSLSAQLLIPAEDNTGDYRDSYNYYMEDSTSSDTLTVIGPDGNRVFFMKATVDSSGTIHATEQLRGVVVTARFKNIPERNGMVRISFEVRVPQKMLNPHWQIRIRPHAVIMEDTVEMEEVHVTGRHYRDRQIKGYELYNRFLSTIITDSSELTHTGLLETFIERNIPLLAQMRHDSSIVDPMQVRGLYGISFNNARQHYLKHLAIMRNNRRAKLAPQKFEHFVSDPYITEGVRIDSVISDNNEDMVYCYSQSLNTRPGLRKIDMTVDGYIYYDGEMRYALPASEPLTFYVSSFATLAEERERFITKVIERKVTGNTTAALEFRAGEYVLDENYGDNHEQISRIKSFMHDIIDKGTFGMDSLTITATCSPEGSYVLNDRLAGLRGKEISGYFRAYVMDCCRKADSIMHEQTGTIINLASAADTENYSSNLGLDSIKFIVKHIPEDWNRLAYLIQCDSSIMDKAGISDILHTTSSPDLREQLLSSHPEYPYIKKQLYPALREVKFDFYLHRKGMVKDTVHTTEPDTVYRAGLVAIRDRDYKKAVQCLGPYKDINSAVAFLAMDYNASAMKVLETLPSSGKRDYLMAIAYSRNGNERRAVECFLNSINLEPSMSFRGNLDPEISRLIEKYNLLSSAE